MTDLEERLRRDLQWSSERAGPGSIRPLRVPPARRRPAAVRWLAPVAAVIAVIGVITGVSLADRPQGHRSAGQQSPVPPEPAGSMPPYYVTLALGNPNTTTALVRDSATGAVLAMAPVPTLVTSNGTQSPLITAAGDDRTFVITELGQEPAGKATRTIQLGNHTTQVPANWERLAKFYLLRVAANGRSASVTRLPIGLPGNLGVTDVALSPDGSMLAIGAQSCQMADGTLHCRYSGIRVITLATGAARNWTSQVPGTPDTLSWAGNGHLAFHWLSPRSYGGYRLLNVTGAGGNLLAAPAIASPAATPTHSVPQALITPDGRAVITSTVRNIPEGNGRDTVVAQIVELDARTGQLLQVLHTATERGVTTREDVPGQPSVSEFDQDCRVLALGPTGVQALAECFGFGRLDGDRFTPLPGVPYPITYIGRTVSGSDFWGTGDW